MTLAVTLDALPNDFIRMMRNWVRGRVEDPGVYAISSAYDGIAASSGYAEGRIPFLRLEFDDVEAAMGTLQLRERAAVFLFWRYEGYGFRWLGRRLGSINHETAKARVDKGHRLVRIELARRVEARSRCRDELAAAQEVGGARRPTGSITTVTQISVRAQKSVDRT